MFRHGFKAILSKLQSLPKIEQLEENLQIIPFNLFKQAIKALS